MKRRRILLIGALVTVMSVSAVAAEDTAGGLLQSLFGAGGPLNEVLPEGTDVDAMIGIAQEQLEQADSEIGSVLNELGSLAEKEGAGISSDVIMQYAEGLLGGFMGSGEGSGDEAAEEDDFDWDNLGAYLEISSSYNAEEEKYYTEYNADKMDPADVQIISSFPLGQSDYDLDSTEITILAIMQQNNFRLNDENQLLFVSGAEDIILFEHEKDEDGNFVVVGTTFAEDGENYTASIEKMIEGLDTTMDQCFDDIAFAEAAVAYDLEMYMNEHPEITGIEYQGEIRTAEELDQIFDDAVSALYPMEEAVTEDAGSLE